MNDKYATIHGKNLFLQFEIPRKYRNKELVLDLIKSLDEGREFITADTFDSFRPGNQHFKFDYAYVIARNMQKPIIELWNLDWRQVFIVASHNPELNKQLFTCQLQNKIF